VLVAVQKEQVPMSQAIVSVRPLALGASGRGQELPVRVTAPVAGERLPVVVFSHGFGQSLDAYAPLVDYWAAHGFVVVQPTHLDARGLGVGVGDERYSRIWRIRVDDLVQCIDELAGLEAAVPGLAGRVDRGRIAVAGHSWGAQSASMLLGARVAGAGEDRTDARVTAGVLLAVPGTGGADLTEFAAEHFPFMNPDFSGLVTPTLVVAGDKDQSALSVRGPEWFTDAYRLSPGARGLLTLFGAEHSLGGIVGYDNTETTDEDPARVARIREVTTAFLRDPAGWGGAGEDAAGRVETR
jgi:predicted dienelactone hydrolase